MQILLLEDDETIASNLKLIFKKLGHNVQHHYTPSDINMPSVSSSDVIVSDFDMQDTTALPLLKYLSLHNIHIPVILNSGNLQAISIIEKNGFTNLISGYTNKMFSIKEWVELLNKIGQKHA